MTYTEQAQRSLDRANGPEALFHLGVAVGLCSAAIAVGEDDRAVYVIFKSIDNRKDQLSVTGNI